MAGKSLGNIRVGVVQVTDAANLPLVRDAGRNFGRLCLFASASCVVEGCKWIIFERREPPVLDNVFVTVQIADAATASVVCTFMVAIEQLLD